MIPSPNDLSYFLEVAAALNLSHASVSLGISQPSLTLAMQRIEKCIGTAVLTRHKNGVTLTKAGKQLLSQTRQLMQRWENIKAETLSSIHEVQGSYSIGCHVSVAFYTLPFFLAELLSQFPRLEIKLEHELSRKITEQVINFAIDVGIVINPVRHPDLIIKKLGDDEVTLWKGSKRYPTQNLQSNEAILICDPDLIQTQSILKKLKKSNITFNRTITSNNLELIAELTKNGCGIGILPGAVAESKNLVRIAKAPTYQDEIAVLYRGENRDIKTIQVIIAAIKNVFKEDPS